MTRNINRWPALVALLLTWLVAAPGLSNAATRKKTAPVKKSAAGSSSKKATVSSSRRVPASRGRTTKSASTRRRTPAAPPRQASPSRERYVEIQQALADKGYSAAPVDGVWGPGWVEALRRFQADQNLEVDGKLGALSIIALGLGPKRTALQVPLPSQQFLAKPGEGAVSQQQQ